MFPTWSAQTRCCFNGPSHIMRKAIPMRMLFGNFSPPRFLVAVCAVVLRHALRDLALELKFKSSCSRPHCASASSPCLQALLSAHIHHSREGCPLAQHDQHEEKRRRARCHCVRVALNTGPADLCIRSESKPNGKAHTAVLQSFQPAPPSKDSGFQSSCVSTRLVVACTACPS